MRTIDGSDGGGQLLRTALTLSVLTETPVRIESIRGSRPDPGLRPQHLAAVELAADYCDATVEGDVIDSETVTFRPGEAREPTLDASIPTAGSVTLLLDTVLPFALDSEEPITVAVTGGTDVKWSPPAASLQRVKLPLLARFGLDAEVELERTGFYPAGGGKVTLRCRSSSLSPIELDDRGAFEDVWIHSKASEDLADRDVADRQAEQARQRLHAAGITMREPTVEYVETRSTGSVILLRAEYERSLAGFDELGEPGRTAEAVADRAVDAFRAFHQTDAAVDEHVADQLLVFLALVGGRVRIPGVADHVETTLALLDRFDCDVRIDDRDDTSASIVASPL